MTGSEDPTTGAQDTRLTVWANPETIEAIERMAEVESVPVSEAVRMHVAIGDYISKEARAGRRVYTEDADGGNRREMVLMHWDPPVPEAATAAEPGGERASGSVLGCRTCGDTGQIESAEYTLIMCPTCQGRSGW